MEKIRVFIAIELPKEMLEALASVQDEIKRGLKVSMRGISWVKPGNTHLTIKFLGDIDQEDVDDIAEALKKAADGVPPFEVTPGDVGGFPSLKNPRVLWVGLDDSDELTGLHENIETELSVLGFEREDRPFRAHLTLCRIKPPADGKAVGRIAEEIKPVTGNSFCVDSFSLIRSQLSPRGARYTVLKNIKLNQDT